MANSPFSREAMTARFWEVKAEHDALQAQMEPLRATQAEIANYRRDEEVVINQQLKALNAEAAPLADEMAMLSRALGGKTGEAADKPYDAVAAAAFHRQNEAEQAAQAEQN